MPKGSGRIPWFLVDSTWEISAKLSTFIHCWPLSPLVVKHSLLLDYGTNPFSVSLEKLSGLCFHSCFQISVKQFLKQVPDHITSVTHLVSHLPNDLILIECLYLFPGYVHTSQHSWRSSGHLESFSLSTTWVLGIELGSPGLAVPFPTEPSS